MKGFGKIIEKTGDAIDKNITSKEERLEKVNKDRSDARDMQESANLQGDKFTKRAIYYLAFFWSIIGALFIILVLFVEIPEPNKRIIDTLIGFVFGAIIPAIINFFFGSSDGSKTKTGLLDRILKK